jgi:hypothetical protein
VDEYMETSDSVTTIDFNIGDILYELSRAPRYVLSLVDREVGFSSAITTTTISVVQEPEKARTIVPLPSNYMRFISLSMLDWNVAVNELLSDTSRAYRDTQYFMRRGTIEQPKAFIIPHVIKKDAVVPQNMLIVKNTGTVAPEIGQEMVWGEDASLSKIIVTESYKSLRNHYWAVIRQGPPKQGVDYIVTGNSELKVMVIKEPGDTYDFDSSNLALEVYPNSEFKRLTYIPYLEPYEMPYELEDALVWYTVSSLLGIVERYDGVKFALDKFQQAINFFKKGMKGDG